MPGVTSIPQAETLPGMPDALAAVPPKAREYEALTLDEVIDRSHRLLDEVQDTYPAERILLLFSGGDDSTLLAHLMRDRADTIVQVNTSIGIPDTFKYVRDVAAAWGLPYLEAHPPESYEKLVLGRVLNKSGPNAGKPAWRGFPGPAAHDVMYQRLKERALAKVRRDIVGARGKTGQIVYVAGMRWSESARRFRNAQEIDTDGAIVWCSPIVYWTAGHMAEYRDRHRCQLDHEHAEHMLCHEGALPLNEVTVHLHMSGDCLCGAYAEEGEIQGIELFYPEIAAQIHALEAEALAAGIPEERCRWGWGVGRERPSVAGRLCSSCPAPMAGQLGMDIEEPGYRPEDTLGVAS